MHLIGKIFTERCYGMALNRSCANYSGGTSSDFRKRNNPSSQVAHSPKIPSIPRTLGRSADDADLRTCPRGDAQAGGGCVGQDWVGRRRRYGHLQPIDNAILRGWWGNPCGIESPLRQHINTQ